MMSSPRPTYVLYPLFNGCLCFDSMLSHFLWPGQHSRHIFSFPMTNDLLRVFHLSSAMTFILDKCTCCSIYANVLCLAFLWRYCPKAFLSVYNLLFFTPSLGGCCRLCIFWYKSLHQISYAMCIQITFSSPIASVLI